MNPIGVFDSGVGGLTVLKELRARMPAEDFIYLGDTARLPYGTKSAQTVSRYSVQCAQRLIERGIRCLVIACNTASASALPALRDAFPAVPVFGVIDPGAAAAVKASQNGHIAVIATQSTIDLRAYERAIRERSPAARISSRSCALFVALAEEGWVDGAVASAVARRYLDEMFQQGRPGNDPGPDTLVLGCTHFPLLLPVLREVVPDSVSIVDSAATTAGRVRDALVAAGAAAGAGGGQVQWLATDGAERFARIGSRFFGDAIRAADVDIIDL